MGEPMMNENFPGGQLADPYATLVDDLTDRVEVGLLYPIGTNIGYCFVKVLDRELQ